MAIAVKWIMYFAMMFAMVGCVPRVDSTQLISSVVNEAVADVEVSPGEVSYLVVSGREWKSGEEFKLEVEGSNGRQTLIFSEASTKPCNWLSKRALHTVVLTTPEHELFDPFGRKGKYRVKIIEAGRYSQELSLWRVYER